MVSGVDRYSASDLYGVLKNTFLTQNTKWEESKKTYPNPGNYNMQLPYFLENSAHGLLITAPSHDAGKDASIATSATALEDTLTNLNQNLTNGPTALVPIAQSRRYLFGLIERKHWTYMEITKNEDGKITAHHYDPKGWLSWLYPTAPIAQAVQQAFGNDVQFQSSYMGHQGLFDNTNCGRFVLSYLLDKAEDKTINTRESKNPSIVLDKFEVIDKVCNTRMGEGYNMKSNSTLSEDYDLDIEFPENTAMHNSASAKKSNNNGKNFGDRVAEERDRASGDTKKFR